MYTRYIYILYIYLEIDLDLNSTHDEKTSISRVAAIVPPAPTSKKHSDAMLAVQGTNTLKSCLPYIRRRRTLKGGT